MADDEQRTDELGDAAGFGDEMPPGSASQAGARGAAEPQLPANVLPFRRDWFGPIDELIPVDPLSPGARGTEDGGRPSSAGSAAAFWGADADFVHELDVPDSGPIAPSDPPASGGASVAGPTECAALDDGMPAAGGQGRADTNSRPQADDDTGPQAARRAVSHGVLLFSILIVIAVVLIATGIGGPAAVVDRASGPHAHRVASARKGTARHVRRRGTMTAGTSLARNKPSHAKHAVVSAPAPPAMEGVFSRPPTDAAGASASDAPTAGALPGPRSQVP